MNHHCVVAYPRVAEPWGPGVIGQTLRQVAALNMLTATRALVLMTSYEHGSSKYHQKKVDTMFLGTWRV